jgi:hypothetical protein
MVERIMQYAKQYSKWVINLPGKTIFN